MAKLVAGSAGGGTGDQTCTIEASGQDDGIIMLTFNNSGVLLRKTLKILLVWWFKVNLVII